MSRIAGARRPEAQRPDRTRPDPVGGTEDRLAREGSAEAGEVRRSPVGPGQAGLDAAARSGRAAGFAPSSGRWRCLDMGTARSEVPRCGYLGTRCLDVGTASGSRWLDMGTRCLDVGTGA